MSQIDLSKIGAPQPEQQLHIPVLPPMPLPIIAQFYEEFVEGQRVIRMSIATPAGINHFYFMPEHLSMLCANGSAIASGITLPGKAA